MFQNYKIPFKTPVDYFIQAMNSSVEGVNGLDSFQKKNPSWFCYDSDLHVYPFVKARACALSMGCVNRCSFCPTAECHRGTVTRGNPEKIIPNYAGENVHFMDEDFFENNDLDNVLPLLKKHDIKWLAMTTESPLEKTIEKYGEDYLYDCGLRVVEMGLENVALMMKIKKEPDLKKVSVYFLNMTMLPGETKETIKISANWMKERSLKNPIHFNNGLWFAPGQFFHPYKNINHDKGEWMNGNIARVKPSWIPKSILEQDYKITEMDKVNFYSQIVYGIKMFPEKTTGNIGEFISETQEKAMWISVGLRVGAIV